MVLMIIFTLLDEQSLECIKIDVVRANTVAIQSVCSALAVVCFIEVILDVYRAVLEVW
jgi:hypothetical protein